MMNSIFKYFQILKSNVLRTVTLETKSHSTCYERTTLIYIYLHGSRFSKALIIPVEIKII